jgi:type II secretory pathway pseudopilin PulG
MKQLLVRTTLGVAVAGFLAAAALPSVALADGNRDHVSVTADQAQAAQIVWDYVRSHDQGVGLPLEASAEQHDANSKAAAEYWANFPIESAGGQYGCDVRIASNVVEFAPDLGVNLHTVTFVGEDGCDLAVNAETRVRVEALPEGQRAEARAFLAATGQQVPSDLEQERARGSNSVDDHEPVERDAWNDSCATFAGIQGCLGRGSGLKLAFGLKNNTGARIFAYSLVGQATSLTGACAPHSAIAATHKVPLDPGNFATAETTVSQNARWYTAVYLFPSDEFKGRHCAVV